MSDTTSTGTPAYPPFPPGPPVPPGDAPVDPGPPKGRGAGKLLAIGLGVLAVGGGAAFAVTSFGGGEGGAATPEEAGEQLVAAVADEDILGIVDLLPDGERELFRDITTGVGDEYQRLGVLSDSFSLDGFEGIELTVTDPEFDADEITDGDGDDDGLYLVTVTDGELELAIDGSALTGNLGDVVEDVADERDVEIDVDDAEEDGDIDEIGELTFAVVEEDGRFHPSLFFTIAELVRQQDDDLDEPDFDDGVEPDGGDSPEAALQALLDAGADLDAEAAIAALDPGEARALHVYGQFFLPVDADVEDLEIDVELTDAEVDDLGGGVNRVVPTGFELLVEVDGGTVEVELEDGCARVDVQPPPDEEDAEPIEEEVCFGDDVDELLPEGLADIEISDELQEVADAFLPLRFGVITVERDGQHFVAPIRTVLDVLLGLTRGLEPEDLEEGGAVFALLSGELDEDVEDLVDQLEDSAFGFEDDFEESFEDFEDEDTETFDRTPFGPSGPAGELLPFDAVEGTVAPGETVSFTALAPFDGSYIVGVQADAAGVDTTVEVLDAVTGESLGFNDDFFGLDPEVLVDLDVDQLVTIEVATLGEDEVGSFIVYFEEF